MTSTPSARNTTGNLTCRILLMSFVLLGTMAPGRSGVAQHRSDAIVSEMLFGEATLASNAAAFCSEVRLLPDTQKVDRLIEWVFPGDGHARLRLDGEFVSHDAWGNLYPTAESPQQLGANIASPAVMLVDLATELGRLDELRQLLIHLQPRDELDQRSQTALRFLVELADGDYAAARDQLGRLYDQFEASSHNSLDDRWPETLATTRGITRPQTRQLAAELLDAMNVRLANDTNRWRTTSTDEWVLHFRAMAGLRLASDDNAQPVGELVDDKTLRNWAPVVRQSARSLGDGYPNATWLRSGSELRHLAGHWQDYLWFRSPLTGDYQVECELSAHPWQLTQLMAAGIWNGMDWNRKGFSEGSFLKTGGIQQLDRPMAQFGTWSRARAVVRDDICTFYFNGRKLSEHRGIEANHPWVALRVNSPSHAAFRNIRITGAPTIPEQLDLIRGEALTGWSAPLGQNVGSEPGWTVQDGELVGRFQLNQQGTVHESLLAYCRPMLEDGEIDFEFLYEPGHVEVAPAIGRTVFAFDPAGIRLHRITNGRFERSDLEPDNSSEVIGHASLTLQPSEWNRARLVLRGNVVTVEVNGEAVCQHTLTIPEQRCFGLFHFADRTAARVRNVVWRGDWPRQLPSVNEQELAAADPDCLVGLDSLKEVTEYPFSQSIPSDQFDFVGDLEVEPRPDGLMLSPPVKDNWSSGRFTLKQPIYGDFDIELKLSELKQEYGNKGTLVVELAVVDDDDTVVGCVRSRGAKDKVSLVAKKSIKNPNGTRQYSGARVEDELEDGTLRIVRRGAEIHALASHGDSPNYRHVGSNRLPAAVSPVHLQMVVASTGGGHTEVVVHSLKIRSNSTAVEQRIDPNVLALDQYVAGFRRRTTHDFAGEGLDGFTATGTVPPTGREQGLTVHARPEASSAPLALAWDAPVEGDFDLVASLQLVALPVTTGGPAPVELSVTLPGSSKRTASLAIQRASPNTLRVEARSANKSATASSPIDATVVANAEVESIEQLRLVRIQNSLLFVYTENGVGRLLAQLDCSDDTLPAGAVLLKTQLPSGAESTGEVRWKQFSIRSTKSGRVPGG